MVTSKWNLVCIEEYSGREIFTASWAYEVFVSERQGE